MFHARDVVRVAELYLGDADPRTPLASPLYADLRGLSPLHIHAGANEVLLDDFDPARRSRPRGRNAGRTDGVARRAACIPDVYAYSGSAQIDRCYPGYAASLDGRCGAASIASGAARVTTRCWPRRGSCPQVFVFPPYSALCRDPVRDTVSCVREWRGADKMEWSEEVIGRLRMLWSEGHSTAEIGRRLGISKNAVVGKAHRLDLPSRPSPIRREGSGSGGERRRAAPRRAAGPTLPPLTSTAGASGSGASADVAAPVPEPPLRRAVQPLATPATRVRGCPGLMAARSPVAGRWVNPVPGAFVSAVTT